MTLTIAQIFGILALVSVVTVMYMRDLKKILIGEIIANLFTAVNYILLGGVSGAGLCALGAINAVVTFTYSKNGKKLSKTVIYIFLAIYALWAIVSYKSPIDLLPAACSFLFAFAIMADSSRIYRALKLGNSALWVAYDFILFAYSASVMHIILVISGMVAIIKMDIIKKK